MAGFSLPTVGQPNSTEDAKVLTALTGLNDLAGQYKTIQERSGGAGLVTGPYYFSPSGLSTTNSVSPGIRPFYWAATECAVAGLTTKWNLRANLVTAGSSAATLTVNVFPVTSVAAGVYSFGASVISVAFVTGALNATATATSGDTAIPADGYYVVAISLSASWNASAEVSAALRVRNV